MTPGWTGCRMDAASPMPLVEGHREENIGCLRPAVSDERIVCRPLEIGVAGSTLEKRCRPTRG